MRIRIFSRCRRMTRRVGPRMWMVLFLLAFIWVINLESARKTATKWKMSVKQTATITRSSTVYLTTEMTEIKPTKNEFLSNQTKPWKLNCTRDIKRRNYMTIEFRPGRTGNALFQVFCLLSLSSKYCYTAIVEYRNRFFRKLLLPVFDIDNIKRVKRLNTSSFHILSTVISKQVKADLQETRQNWTLDDRCVGHAYLQGQEKYIKSSIQFKHEIQEAVNIFLKTNFRKRSTVAIHVRRTDKMTKEPNYEYADLEWYKPFINKSIHELKVNYTNLAFIFVSDDLDWCKANFQGQDIYFSPCKDPGCDLALMASCDHVVITIGTFGWMGAWLGDHRTVIYSSKFVPSRFYRKEFFLPSWIGMGE